MRLFFAILFAFTQIVNTSEEAEQNRQNGIRYKNAGQSDSALYYLRIAQNQFTALQDSLGVANVIVNIASLENNKGNYIRSFELYQNALSYYHKLNAAQGIIKVYVNLGNQQLRLNNLNEAFTSYLKAEEFAIEAQHQKYLGYIYNGLGSIIIKKDFEERSLVDAEKYFNLALDYFKQANNVSQSSYVYNNLGIIYSESEEYSKAIDSYQKYIELGLAEKNQLYLLQGYHNISIIYKTLNEYDLSLEYLGKAEEIALAIPDPINYIHILSNLVDVNMSLKNFEAAQSYLEKYKSLRDSVYDEGKTETLAELQVKYKTKEKEELLNKEIELSNERKWRIIFLSALAFVLTLAIVIIIWLNRKRRAQERKNLERQKEIESLRSSIEGENKERKRLASDLHDSVGGMLTAARMIHSSYLEEGGEKATKVDHLLNDLSNTIRTVSHNLSTNTLERYGLVKSIEQAVETIQDKFTVNFIVDNHDMDLPTELARPIDFVIKELINNTIKHSLAGSIDIQMSMYNHTLIITYEDDGQGFDINQQNAGIGLSNIEKRVGLINGTIDLNSSPGDGFVCSIEVPVE